MKEKKNQLRGHYSLQETKYFNCSNIHGNCIKTDKGEFSCKNSIGNKSLKF